MALDLATLTQPLDVSRWCPGARYGIVIDTVGGQVLEVYQGPCLLVGALLRAGAADTTMKLFNSRTPNLPGTQNKELPGVRTSVFDGFVNFPVYVSDGIVATISQTDALGWVFFIPLPNT